MNKPQLAILSDLFGNSQEDWMNLYISRLSPYFNITHYDSRELARIQLLPQAEVHQAFVNGGIDLAVKQLISSAFNPDVILGFSVGGTIAWKFALQNHQPSLCLISATRLRNETNKPSTNVHLVFGQNEEHGPTHEWFEKFNLTPKIISEEGHDCYKNERAISFICNLLLSNIEKKF